MWGNVRIPSISGRAEAGETVIARVATDIAPEVVDRARTGDQEALAALYDWYMPRVYRYVLARVGNVMEAEDLTEEIFLKVLVAIDQFRWKKVPFSAWLFRIARNQVVSYFRRASSPVRPGRLPPDSFDSLDFGGGEDPMAVVERRLAVEEVLEAVRLLPGAQREVILLRFGADLSVKETARVLGKREGNVKALQFKAVARLQKVLNPSGRQPAKDQRL